MSVIILILKYLLSRGGYRQMTLNKLDYVIIMSAKSNNVLLSVIGNQQGSFINQ